MGIACGRGTGLVPRHRFRGGSCRCRGDLRDGVGGKAWGRSTGRQSSGVESRVGAQVSHGAGCQQAHGRASPDVARADHLLSTPRVRGAIVFLHVVVTQYAWRLADVATTWRAASYDGVPWHPVAHVGSSFGRTQDRPKRRTSNSASWQMHGVGGARSLQLRPPSNGFVVAGLGVVMCISPQPVDYYPHRGDSARAQHTQAVYRHGQHPPLQHVAAARPLLADGSGGHGQGGQRAGLQCGAGRSRRVVAAPRPGRRLEGGRSDHGGGLSPSRQHHRDPRRAGDRTSVAPLGAPTGAAGGSGDSKRCCWGEPRRPRGVLRAGLEEISEGLRGRGPAPTPPGPVRRNVFRQSVGTCGPECGAAKGGCRH